LQDLLHPKEDRGSYKGMTFTKRQLLWRCRKGGCIAMAVLAILAIYGTTISRHPAAGEMFAAQSGEAFPAPRRTPINASTPASISTASKPASSPNSHPRLSVKSRIALVEDANTSEELLVKDADRVVPIASITKLMTAIVVLNAKPPMEEKLKISDEDRDLVMGTSSRLHVGWTLSREDMLHLALMSSENRAAAALSRYYPGGRPAFIKAMNDKAADLGMAHTHFVNPNGLTSENVSTAHDLVKLVRAANQYPLIRQFTTNPGYDVRVSRYVLAYFNSNRLVGQPAWDIDVQKTGFTNEAGDCLVMMVNADGRALIMVFLDAYGKLTRFADARRVVMQLAMAERR
jgi:D-alanyl-D-alanine endopeptidase (penicillin-binding protein 7)